MRLNPSLLLTLLFFSASSFGADILKGKDVNFRPEADALAQGQNWLAADLVDMGRYSSDASFAYYRKLAPLKGDEHNAKVLVVKTAFAVDRDATVATTPNLFTLPYLNLLFPDLEFKAQHDSLRATHQLSGLATILYSEISCDVNFDYRAVNLETPSDLENAKLVAMGKQSCVNFNHMFLRANTFYRFYRYKDKTIVMISSVSLVLEKTMSQLKFASVVSGKNPLSTLASEVFAEAAKFQENLKKFDPRRR